MAPPTTKRLLYLDALRGIAVLLMIEQHLGVWLWRGPKINESLLDYPWLIAFNALGGMAAPLFISLAAIGCVFYANEQKNNKMILFERGLLILVMGYIFNFLITTWFSLQSWFILHMIGLGVLISPLLLALTNHWLWCLGILIIFTSPCLQNYLAVPWFLTNEYMAGQIAATIWTPYRIPLVEGHFPIFPWLGMYILGIIAGRWLLEAQYQRLTTIGGLMILLGALGHFLIWQGIFNDIPWAYRALRFQAPFFPAPAALIVLLTGCVWLSLSLIHSYNDWRPFSATHWLVVLGRVSLTLLILHVWLFRQLGYQSFLWGQLSALASSAVFIGFVIFCVLLGKQWQKSQYLYSVEWLLKTIQPKSSKRPIC